MTTAAPRIGFAGLTHLGLVSSIAAASKGFSVVGFDPDKGRVAAITAGDLPVREPDLDDLLAANRARITFTGTIGDLGSCDLVYVATDVPTDDEGGSDLSGIESLIEALLPVLAPHAVMVVLCQVPPGFTRRLPLAPGRLVYQVETLVFGRAVERATLPERFIIGLSDPAQPLPPALEMFLTSFGCPLLPMRYESAELAKISINCCLAASVSVANTLAELSEAIGADWNEIVPALKLDRRIGQHAYLAPGLGLSGGNIERDLATVLRFAEAESTEASTIAGFVANSRHTKDWAWRQFRRFFPEGRTPRIAVLGLAYKENTHSTKNSPALQLLEKLEGMDVTVHDPAVPATTVPWAKGAATAMEAVAGADVTLVMTPWPEFRSLDLEAVARAMAGAVVIDPYRLFDPGVAARAGIGYAARGLPAFGADGPA